MEKNNGCAQSCFQVLSSDELWPWDTRSLERHLIWQKASIHFHGLSCQKFFNTLKVAIETEEHTDSESHKS
jgi:hypothetical protein